MQGNSGNEALSIYKRAVKLGQKYYDSCLREGQNPYLPALDEMVPEIRRLRTQYLGLMDIPADLIAGTKTAGRTDAFAGNFMPLLDWGSEFGMKWVDLCASHLSEGIREPVKAFEYLGKFYIQEGNKRVSVLLSFGAAKIPGTVTRIYPSENTPEKVRRDYEDFLSFYNLSGLYTVHFTNTKNYAKLQASLGFAPDHIWTAEERAAFSSRLFVFTQAFNEVKGSSYTDLSASDALLCWLQVYSFDSLKTMPYAELLKTIGSVWPEIMLMSGDKNEPLSMKPQEVEKNFISKLFTYAPDCVSVAFIHSATSFGSNWVKGHENGAKYLENALGERVSVKNYYADAADAETVMETAIGEGAEVLFVTAPTLISATRKMAALHPDTVLLVCALSMPMAGVQCYYSRIYEAKFISGAIAGAMSDSNTIGYIARSPIFGVPAEINAFALGARMTNYNARIELRWTGAEEDPFERLRERGIRTVSGMDIISRSDMQNPGSLNMGTFQQDENGQSNILVAPCWYWGTFYERVLRYIINGEWAEVARDKGGEVDYWWGLDSGVIDVKLSENLPYGVIQLAKILKKGIISGGIDIFKTPMTDQNGIVRNDGSAVYSPMDIMKMDWILDNVDGEIPPFEKLLPKAQGLTRILGIYRDEIPPEKEEFLL